MICFARGLKSFIFSSNSSMPKEKAIILTYSSRPRKECKGVPWSYRKIIQLPEKQGRHRTTSWSVWFLQTALKISLSLSVAEA